jgi:hypothetical protein
MHVFSIAATVRMSLLFGDLKWHCDWEIHPWTNQAALQGTLRRCSSNSLQNSGSTRPLSPPRFLFCSVIAGATKAIWLSLHYCLQLDCNLLRAPPCGRKSKSCEMSAYGLNCVLVCPPQPLKKPLHIEAQHPIKLNVEIEPLKRQLWLGVIRIQ